MQTGNAIGQTLDSKYKIESQLGKGGMGTVYLATHLGTERPVAVKIIASEFMKRPEFVERFRREARAAGRLRHPNVVDVTDFGFSKTKEGDVAYLVMEYLDGCTLGEILKEEKNLPVSWTIDILEQVCSAVHEAHQQGIIHRDLKPDNIWLEPNQRGGYTVKVLDFGIAKLEEAQLTISERASVATVLETQLIDGENTFAEDIRSNTIVDRRHTTLVSESATMAISDSAQNLDTEAGTMIQKHKEDANFSSNQTRVDVSTNDATRLIDHGDETDKSEPQETAKSPFASRATADLTRVGAVLGTPLYMSPEQCRGEKLTPHSDVYSLGVIAYQMLDGCTPFDGNYSDVMEAHKSAEPPMLRQKKIPKKVKQVINASLAKNTEERPQTAEGFASELRASSEGLGALLRRALVIYSQHIPKFLQIAFLLALPPIILMIVNIGLRFLTALEIISNTTILGIVGGIVSLVHFFAQIFYAALLVGMTTWIVAQVLAAPLRPISVKATFRQVAKRWKPLGLTVTASTLLSFLSWIVGATAGAVLSLVISGPIYYFTGQKEWLIGFGIGFGLLGFIVLGVLTSSAFMLIAPSIMMEGVRGRAAFRRSIELIKRSFRTVVATAILVYIVPIGLAMAIALSLTGLMNAFDPPEKAAEKVVAEQSGETAIGEGDLSFKLDGKGLRLTTDTAQNEKQELSMAKKLRNSIQQGLYELLWTPISMLMFSFTSVITALLYFKTRQAGGESLHELLLQFEEDECEVSNWKTRVRERLLQSGRTTTGKKFTTG